MRIYIVNLLKHFEQEHTHTKLVSQWAKSPKKQSVECIFDNMALYFECLINKNALLQTPSGMVCSKYVFFNNIQESI